MGVFDCALTARKPPLWQVEHLPVTLASCVMRAPVQTEKPPVWQTLHCAVVGMWPAVLPWALAKVKLPLWHEAQSVRPL